jgi:NhaP-type Na+/H+ or K+/H+ antiporter
MNTTLWYVIAGAVFVMMALASSLLKRLPLSTSLLYLVLGVGIGPLGLGLLHVDPVTHAGYLERLSEIAVLISLFAAGLKLRASLRDRVWRVPLRLAFGAMLITVALIAWIGVAALGLPLGAAILLGAVLAPTDPVLASDVQVEDPTDRDRLRFGLTGEAGLNDGAAFPFVILGLALLGGEQLGQLGWRWLLIDVLYAGAGGLATGWLLGTLVGRVVIYLRREHREAVGLDDFLALGLIALAYGVGHLVHVYGFLAVFAAGLALRHLELKANEEKPPEASQVIVDASATDTATDAEHAPAYMAQAILGFNEQLERIAEVAMVLLLGSLLIPLLPSIPAEARWFIPLLLLAIRPAAVIISLIGTGVRAPEQALIAWFGIRGIGSVYYLMYAITHGLPEEYTPPLLGITIATIVASIVVHGISVTPLMQRYRRSSEARRPVASGPQAMP